MAAVAATLPRAAASGLEESITDAGFNYLIIAICIITVMTVCVRGYYCLKSKERMQCMMKAAGGFLATVWSLLGIAGKAAINNNNCDGDTHNYTASVDVVSGL